LSCCHDWSGRAIDQKENIEAILVHFERGSLSSPPRFSVKYYFQGGPDMCDEIQWSMRWQGIIHDIRKDGDSRTVIQMKTKEEMLMFVEGAFEKPTYLPSLLLKGDVG
jgi:hypothetical protein